MNVAEASIRYRTVTLVMAILIIGMGLVSYEKLGRLEDPEFTIKDAQIFTQYPGATAAEVAEEVTDELETAVQQLGQLERVTSRILVFSYDERHLLVLKAHLVCGKYRLHVV